MNREMTLSDFMKFYEETVLVGDTGKSDIYSLSDTFKNIDASNFVLWKHLSCKQIQKSLDVFGAANRTVQYSG